MRKEEYTAVPLDVFALAEQKRRAIEGDDGSAGEDDFLVSSEDNKVDNKLIAVLLTTFSGGIAAGLIATSLATLYMYNIGFSNFESETPRGLFGEPTHVRYYELLRAGVAFYHTFACLLCLLPGIYLVSAVEKRNLAAYRKTWVSAFILSSLWFLGATIPALFMLMTHILYPVFFFASVLSILLLILSLSVLVIASRQYSAMLRS